MNNNNKLLWYVVRYVNLADLKHFDTAFDSEEKAIRYARMFDNEIIKDSENLLVYKVYGFTREEIEKDGANVLSNLKNRYIIDYKL